QQDYAQSASRMPIKPLLPTRANDSHRTHRWRAIFCRRASSFGGSEDKLLESNPVDNFPQELDVLLGRGDRFLKTRAQFFFSFVLLRFFEQSLMEHDALLQCPQRHP